MRVHRHIGNDNRSGIHFHTSYRRREPSDVHIASPRRHGKRTHRRSASDRARRRRHAAAIRVKRHRVLVELPLRNISDVASRNRSRDRRAPPRERVPGARHSRRGKCRAVVLRHRLAAGSAVRIERHCVPVHRPHGVKRQLRSSGFRKVRNRLSCREHHRARIIRSPTDERIACTSETVRRHFCLNIVCRRCCAHRAIAAIGIVYDRILVRRPRGTHSLSACHILRDPLWRPSCKCVADNRRRTRELD